MNSPHHPYAGQEGRGETESLLHRYHAGPPFSPRLLFYPLSRPQRMRLG
ncbi:hypothetical protein LCGC14_0676790 [marine sediment metagenome]|uniref:Uncharacterized protein n=1 Tax=marine sediment metagenome TaxID=412755 RepID=A0A0F9QPD3_9ZZZZ